MTDFSDIEAISYDNDGNVLAFTKDGDSWTYDGDNQFPVNTTRMDSLAGTVKKLPAVRRLEGGDDLAAYGLDTPLRRVTVSAESVEISCPQYDKAYICESDRNSTSRKS